MRISDWSSDVCSSDLKIKRTSAKAIKELQEKGIDVIMLTGDNHDTAQAIASELHLTNFKAGVLPEDKLKEVERLQEKGEIVAMAGEDRQSAVTGKSV